jgi:hypothetical protein
MIYLYPGLVGLRNKKTIKVILTKNSDQNIGLEFFLYSEKIEFYSEVHLELQK